MFREVMHEALERGWSVKVTPGGIPPNVIHTWAVTIINRDGVEIGYRVSDSLVLSTQEAVQAARTVEEGMRVGALSFENAYRS